ncbi:2,4-dichlorophenol 6-monooxygenase [Phaeobacter gallaeciensis]|uniref:2,4-dichlorophenol 6-monooxygenase n=1 Tax=Phaeobacter gallaeciensis TaxID=60890 RepID=A0A1B0ZNJ9_9RHOB|nr:MULTISPECIES: FAD-dependent monooxygenase [Phaeobacter]MDF1770906.1 FAD-dependent monooxygenase [Pseudophaeobacter sp. bin_em_oilr2.035]MEE2633927.1 FAD-dependent monooxygenase [Pseudomonadota bacterium]ANP35762.1 2,4-dichlorophenol 6-monooxygenase [Phaeobacter gallaeciensis]MDE4061696.1 FAD-dependent monooxygenase [Phaeobacter gallaeciensis]MDE4124716.1 FAD-dependent monooxygenase [Phaeobacter gallaeciensis]
MADITTEVLIIGTGPAGSVAAALLSSYGIENVAINRYHWLANTPRAHITNQRTMEVLRDLGKEVEDEVYLNAMDQSIMGENVFCESLAGEEIGRMKSWGTHPLSKAEHMLSSPTFMNDLPQTFMEPILFKTACKRGTRARMSTEYKSHVQDAEGVTTTCYDRMTGQELTIRSKYLIGADGGNSLVAENENLPFEGQMGVGGSMNIVFRADLSKYVAHRPSVLYWVMQPGADVGGIGMGLVRCVRPWNEWLIVWGYDINEPAPNVDEAMATDVARQLVGDPELEIELLSANTWTVNDTYATRMSRGRVFIMGDAAHRHPPSNGLGSNTSIQDAFNLAWKLAAVVKGQAGERLLETYSEERAPVAKQIVTRANQSIGEFGPIFEALGMTGGTDITKIKANMDARCDSTPEAEAQREALNKAIAFKKYEFDAHGVEMNQRYRSDATVTDGQIEPDFKLDADLHYQPTTWPGARIPHAWLFDAAGQKHSTLDLAGGGAFTIFTGLGGEAWVEAASKIAKEFGITLNAHVIGPRQEYMDYTGDWARAREVGDSGCIITRPDQHVCWRHDGAPDNAEAELTRVFKTILAR